MWWEIPNHLEVKNGELHIANAPAAETARHFGTPLYVYNEKRIADVYRRFSETIEKYAQKKVRIHYAMKANSNEGILRLLRREGAWIDAVSPEEARKALEAGFPKDKILFTGTSVSNNDMKQLVELGIRINVDSLSQVRRLRNIAPAGTELSLRMDPGITGASGHWKTMTAGRESHGLPIKFSIPESGVITAAQLARDYGFRVVGLHEHIGSNWRTDEEVNEFLQTVDVVLEKAKQLTAMGCELEFVSFGGGPGVRYMENHPEFPLERYAEETCRKVAASGIECEALCFEPGRYLVADSGLLLMEVVDVKERYGDVIAGVNSGFNHLIRPVLYDAHHEIINCTKAGEKADTVVTVAGNLCETGDVFAAKRVMPKPEEGDILAVHNAGAYGFSMASHYNLRSLPQEVLL
ncbi:MAG: diaminopimelate decarboxylase [Candidatus Aenigmarchaeota archaeon]|nr:diaminopimelate decarboxylase [Candidatus Aenigmarchaeota archaeon]